MQTVPLEINSEVLRTLVPELPGSRNTIIEGQIAVAVKIASWYAKRYRKDKEELIAVANLELVRCVDRACKGSLHDDNIAAYIAVNLHGACRAHIQGDHLVRVERRAVREYYTRYGRPGIMDIREESAEHPVDDNMIWGELMDMFSLDQQMIIRMRLAGYNQTEIGLKLDWSQPSVARGLEIIREKLIRIGVLSNWLQSYLAERDN